MADVTKREWIVRAGDFVLGSTESDKDGAIRTARSIFGIERLTGLAHKIESKIGCFERVTYADGKIEETKVA